jgi:hypothetical protein
MTVTAFPSRKVFESFFSPSKVWDGKENGFLTPIAMDIAIMIGMTIEQLRQLHRAQPFRPFEIHLADGRSLPVEHPEMMSQSQSGRTIAVARPDDTIEIIDMLLVVSLKPRPNGRPRRR